MIAYHLAQSLPLPALPRCLYQYVLAGNGVFIRAERPGLFACIWHAAAQINGLPAIEPAVILPARVPYEFLLTMLDFSRQARPNEILFYLLRDDSLAAFDAWRLIVPHQAGSTNSVRPVDPFNLYSQSALIECHSHHDMGAFFSSTDDKDETGFRIYAVLGEISTRPVIAVRVGIYGNFYPIPADWIFELPANAAVEDVLSHPVHEVDYDYSHNFIE